MMEIVRSDESVCRTMITDIYQIGLILNKRKFRYLRYSYLVFLTGLILAAATAVLSYMNLLP